MVESEYFLIVLAFILSMGLSLVSIPTLVHIARMKNLCAAPTERGAHIGWIPNLGGVAIFASLMIIMNLLYKQVVYTELQFLNASIVILFLLGVKDDILVIDPSKKFLGQLLVAILLTYFGDIRITNFHGFLGIYELNYWFDLLFSTFMILLIINAYNLIDGIDGLASGIALIGMGSFTSWFIINEFYFYSLLGVVMIGTLSGFFYFNTFSKKNKLFLGDTGAMIVGLMIGVLAIKFIQLSMSPALVWDFNAVPSVAFGIIAIPICDVFRVFILRIKKRKSPFKADRQHIHHVMLNLGYSHRSATLRILVMNLFLILLCWLGRNWQPELLFLAVIVLFVIFSVVLKFMSNNRAKIPMESKTKFKRIA